jgi:hypothetical protein
MLQVATEAPFWTGTAVELSMSFDNLRDYQWKRLLEAIWSYKGLSGPLAERYHPGDSEPPKTERRVPNPTDAFSQFGICTLVPDVRVGIEVQTTRSLFECATLRIPLRMFANVPADPANEGLKIIEKAYYEIALHVYQMVTFDIAAIGLNRECQLVMELVSDKEACKQFLAGGNFLARDDTLAALGANPRSYQEVQPTLRWSPPKNP